MPGAPFLRSLRVRGLDGVQLAVSDHHEGLKHAIAQVLACSWQRCTVQFVRNMHAHCRRHQRGLVSVALREVFNAEHHLQARERVTHVIERLSRSSARREGGCPRSRRAPGRAPSRRW